jgi:hypothetical protein
VRSRCLDLGRFVHTTGAVYAFAPSLSTLRLLGEDRSMQGERGEAASALRWR